MTGAQVMSARSSQPPNTALIRAPRPNTGCDPVQPHHQHSVATSLLSPDQVTSTQSDKCCDTQLSAPPLSQVAKCLTFASHLTYLFT